MILAPNLQSKIIEVPAVIFYPLVFYTSSPFLSLKDISMGVEKTSLERAASLRMKKFARLNVRNCVSKGWKKKRNPKPQGK